MKTLFIVLSVIVVAYAKPAEYNSQYDEPISVSDESDDKSDEPIANIPVSVFTKYPDDPTDELRIRRRADSNEADPSIDVIKLASSTSDDTKREERKTEEQVRVPLRGYIKAIESDLVSRAVEANLQLRKKRSTEGIVSDEDNENDSKSEEIKKQNTTDAVDVNKNFFEGIFDFTRPQRETEDKELKIPLDGLVHAVETTLVHSAKNLKDANETKHAKRDTSSEESDESNEDSDAETEDTKLNKKPIIKVEKIHLTPSASLDLNLLDAITFKPVSVAPVSEQSTASDEELVSTTENPIQKTNLTVLQASNSLRLVPSFDNKLAHVQRQEISQTVFHSSLAIFPTIPPQTINAPLPQLATTEVTVETTPVHASSSTGKSDEETKREQMLAKVEKLKEKIAEIQANPVILSAF